MSAADKLDERRRFDRGFWREPNGAIRLRMPDGKSRMLGAPSGVAKKHLEDTRALDLWRQRMVALGVVELQQRGDLPTMPVDPEANGARDILDGIADQALEAANGKLAAARGTYAHLLSELNDEGAVWLQHLADGQDMGLEPEMSQAIVDAWNGLIELHGLNVLAVEQTVVSEATMTAGTLDRLVALTKALTFHTPTGEVTVPAGTVVVLDVKTSRLRVSPTKAAQPLYWNAFAHQCYCYATGTPVHIDSDDPDGHNFWPWPEPPSTEHALIAHLDVHGMIDTGTMSAQLVYVDLAAGVEQQAAVEHVKAVRKVKPFSRIAEPDVIVDLPVPDLDVRVERWLRKRIDLIGLRPEAKQLLGAHWDPTVTPPGVDGYDPATADVITTLLDAVERETQMPFGETDPRAAATEPRRR